MVTIKYETKKIRLVLIILSVVGVLMLVVGGFMLSRYSSSTATEILEPTAKEVLSTPSSLKITGLVINPTEIDPGEEVIITAEFTNTGDTENGYTVELMINDIVEAAERVTLPAGGTKILSFYGSKGVPGAYIVTVGELTGQFVVVEPIEITQVKGFETIDGESITQCGCSRSSTTTESESPVSSCCASYSESTVPEPTVPSCCGG